MDVYEKIAEFILKGLMAISVIIAAWKDYRGDKSARDSAAIYAILCGVMVLI